jgi:glycerol-3-phosphate dehydrogenase
MTSPPKQTVLILGAGINGSAVARELALNGVPVTVIDRHDIAWGATSRSSRLIHGGLRYLEHGEFRLVRESLEERSRLRKLAPQFVKPFWLHIPVSKRSGGLWNSALGFLSGGRWGKNGQTPRGMWLVRMGLWFYDRFGRDRDFPASEVVPINGRNVPAVDAKRFRWLCRYTDAQMIYPERFVISMLRDASDLAREKGIPFEMRNYHELRPASDAWDIVDLKTGSLRETVKPALIVNATGAWGDITLEKLNVSAPQLFGGTKGSHFVTHHAGLREAVNEQGVYAEADDGRLVFILPLAGGVMVGTTDERFEGNPDHAVASGKELDYLVEMVNDLFPQVGLTREDIAMHCAGVRPLPRENVAATSAISRDHSIHESEKVGTTILTLVGGKLTTARAFGESVADEVLSRMNIKRTAGSRERLFPGGADYPSEVQLSIVQEELARTHQRPTEQIQAMWPLCGTEVKTFLTSLGSGDPTVLDGTNLPYDFARWIIEREWVVTLEDLVERRLMLLYHDPLTETCLGQLADLLVEAGRIKPEDRAFSVNRAADRLWRMYGKRIATAAPSPLATEPVAKR